MIEQPPLGSIVNDLLNPSFEAVGAPVELRRNLALNPSFEAESPTPAGATRTDDWAADGTWSIHVPAEVTHLGGGVYSGNFAPIDQGNGLWSIPPHTHLGDGQYTLGTEIT